MMMTRNKQTLLILSVLLLSLVWAGTVFAHTVEVLSATVENGEIVAQAPAEIKLVFNEEMRTDESTLTVFAASGEQVDLGDGHVDLNDPNHATMVASLPDLPPGEYTIRWRVVLLDGDPTDGAQNFFVGDEAAAAAAGFSPLETEEAPEPVTAVTNNNNGLPDVVLMAAGAVTVLLVIGLVVLLARKFM
jgi:methionine-rich copper-binding protein CopC